MQYRKWAVGLAAFAVASFALGVPQAAHATAPSISSVEIVRPDSGRLVGIDSLIIARATLQVVSPTADQGVIFYLVAAGANTRVVTDATTGQTIQAGVSGGTVTAEEAVLFAAGVTPLTTAFSVGATSAENTTHPASSRGVVLGQQFFGASGAALRGTAAALNGATGGDGDSIVVDVSGSLPTFTWYYKLSAAVGTGDSVQVVAIALDKGAASPGYSSPARSPASRLFRLDGDRPNSSALSITDLAAFDVQTLGPVTVNSTPVYGIGDSIRARIDLGTSDVAVIFGDSLTVELKLKAKRFAVSKTDRAANSAVLRHRIVLAEGTFYDLQLSSAIDNVANALLVDAAGNRSGLASSALAGRNDAVESGVTTAATFLVDTKAPVLDGQVAAGDTVLPVSNDTITDGGGEFGFLTAHPDPDPGWLRDFDLNRLTYALAEPLDSLLLTFDGATTDATFAVWNQGVGNADVNDGDSTHSAMRKNVDLDVVSRPGMTAADTVRTVDFTALGTSAAGTAPRNLFVRDAVGVAEATYALGSTAATIATNVGAIMSGTAAGDTLLKTGVYTVRLRGRDLGGNLGPQLTRTNVYIDVDTLGFARLFPTNVAGLDSLETQTARVVFRLTEPADSVQITYAGTGGSDLDSLRIRKLVGSELTNTSTEQTFTVGNLKHGSSYKLLVSGRDLAGNFTQVVAGTFVYDTTFVVPVIAKFQITPTAAADSGRVGLGKTLPAGTALSLTIKALTVDNRPAVTYKETAVLNVTGGSGVALSGTGVTDQGGGRALLSADDWIVGQRQVTLVDTTSIDTLAVTVSDSSDTTNLFVGSLDSAIVVVPGLFTQFVLSADDTVGQGDNFFVGVTISDKFGNLRGSDNAFVEVSTPSIGVQLPHTAVAVSKGSGGFWANSSGFSGLLTLTVRDVVDTNNVITAGGQRVGGGNFFSSSIAIYVDGNGATVLDDPDTLIAEDYMGANGTGDQGGFVILTFPVSSDHGTLDGYRIYRNITVNHAPDSLGAQLVALAEPSKRMAPWARVDAVPGQAVMYVVVATLDGDATEWGVAAERGGLTTKEAFDTAEAVSTPYELMAQTMQKSREAVTVDAANPLFAALTPEALAYSEKGVVPRLSLKMGDNALVSHIRQSEAVRAIDNLPPAAITFLQAQDTPDDIGGSITVKWTKSADDRMLSYTVAQAVGLSNTFTTAGVEGYNVYRQLGDAAWQMVGQTGAGETSFEDATVFHGVRYGYKVEARDADNVTDSGLSRTAMAFRNRVLAADGTRILGLYGADAKVDLDDFFIFADHFGLTAGTVGFDRAFDLDVSNAVDLSDFFLFADNFGREMAGTFKSVPTMAGLNSDARFNLEAVNNLPRVGEELSIAVRLEDFVEVNGYGLTIEFDSQLLEFVEPRVTDNLLGEGALAAPQVFTQDDGKVTIAALGQTATEGDLGLNLVFRAKQEIESSYIDVTSGALRDATYGQNAITSTASVRIETRPEFYALADNYPNPFNPETTIKYQLPEAGNVRLEVYNMLGQVVRTLVNNEFQNAGRYALKWNATNDSGQPLSSGVYFYRIVAGGEFQSHKKMLLLK